MYTTGDINERGERRKGKKHGLYLVVGYVKVLYNLFYKLSVVLRLSCRIYGSDWLQKGLSLSPEASDNDIDLSVKLSKILQVRLAHPALQELKPLVKGVVNRYSLVPRLQFNTSRAESRTVNIIQEP